jgi:uncharacterized protein (TIGR00369 family)
MTGDCHLPRFFEKILSTDYGWRMMNLQFNSASCFACGLENPAGLRLQFYDDGKDRVFTRFMLELQHAGYPGMAHGGVVAAILDEVGGRTVMINNPNRFFVTAHMEARFRQPVPVGVPLEATGWLIKRRASRTRAHAEIFTDKQCILAEADILYTDFPSHSSFWLAKSDPKSGTRTWLWSPAKRTLSEAAATNQRWPCGAAA